MKAIEVFYSRALEAFREAGGTEEEMMWLVGSRLALFPAHRDEIRLRLRILQEIVKRSSGKILEVGCGSGLLSLLLSERGTVVGIEKTADFFPFLRKLENERLKFVHGDFLSDDVGRGFDTVVFSYILHDVEPEPFLSRAVKILSPCGRIVVGDFDLNGLKKRLKESAGLHRLAVEEELALGHALSHGRECEAFLLVFRRVEK